MRTTRTNLPKPFRDAARSGAVLAVLTAAGGCVSVSPSGPRLDAHALAYAQAGHPCTDMIAAGGGIVRLCQSERTVDVFESGIGPAPSVRSPSLVDDPQVLAALQGELTLRPELASSRRIVSRSCAVGDRRYLTLSVESLRRILRSDARLAARGGFDPVATGSLAAPDEGSSDAGARAPGGNDATAR